MLPYLGPSLPPEQMHVLQLSETVRSWTIPFVLIAGVSIFGGETIDIAWAVILIIVAILAWKNRTPSIFIIYAVFMGWAAIVDSLSIFLEEGMERLWVVIALVQAICAVIFVRKYKKYRHLQLYKQFQSGNWPKDLPPPNDEVEVMGRYATLSRSLSTLVLILLPLTCMVFFAYLLSVLEDAATGQSVQYDNLISSFFEITVYSLIALAVLSLGLGLAAMTSEHKKKSSAKAGVVMSSIELGFLILVFILLVIDELVTQAGVLPPGT